MLNSSYEDQKYPREFEEGDVIDTSRGYAQKIVKLVSIEKKSPGSTFATYKYLVRSNISDNEYVVGFKENLPYSITKGKRY